MGNPSSPIPGNLPDAVRVVWQDVTEAFQTGDLDILKTALQDYLVLDTTDQITIEQMATMLPFPGLPPQLISTIFANPEATIGIIDRLEPAGSNQTGNTSSEDASQEIELGIVERAIVMDALISWLQAQQVAAKDLASSATDAATQSAQEAKDKDKKKDTKDTTATATNGVAASAQNPVNAALINYIKSGGAMQGTVNLSSLQFLKMNPITLVGLQLASPELLNQAYQVAAGQLLLTLATQFNPAVSATQDASDQNQGYIIQQNLLQSIKKALQDQAIPLNPQVFLVLMTVMTMPTLQLGNQSLASNQTGINQAVGNIALGNAASKNPNLQVAGVNQTSSTDASSLNPVYASVLAAIPSLFSSEGITISQTFAEQLGALSVVYNQMAPYWMAPGAVSLMTKAGGEATQASKSEASVRAYAIGVAALMNDPSFNSLLTAIIKLNLPNITAEQLNMFISAMKISVLTNALVALYITLIRKTQGQFSAEDLKEMILGKVPLPADDLETGLIKSIQAELALMKLSDEQQDAFLTNLLSAYNANTDVSSLTEPSTQLLNLCDPSFLLSITSHTPL